MKDGPWNFKVYITSFILTVLSVYLTGKYGFSLKYKILISILAAYAPSYFDGSSTTVNGRAWVAFQKLVLRRKNISMTFTEKLDPEKLAIICGHPHGFVSFNHVAVCSDSCGWYSQKIYTRNRRDLGASVVFLIPIWRDICQWMGCIDASKWLAQKCLREGTSLFILPGGEMEQFYTEKGKHKIFINTRKGFVKLAIENGAHIYPYYAFGENDTYETSKFLYGIRYWLVKNLRVCVTFGYTKCFGIPVPFPLAPPSNKNIDLCFAKIIKPKQMSPKDEGFEDYVNKVHEEYIQALVDVFDKNKERHGYPDGQLEILPKLKHK